MNPKMTFFFFFFFFFFLRDIFVFYSLEKEENKYDLVLTKGHYLN